MEPRPDDDDDRVRLSLSALNLDLTAIQSKLSSIRLHGLHSLMELSYSCAHLPACRELVLYDLPSLKVVPNDFGANCPALSNVILCDVGVDGGLDIGANFLRPHHFHRNPQYTVTISGTTAPKAIGEFFMCWTPVSEMDFGFLRRVKAIGRGFMANNICLRRIDLSQLNLDVACIEEGFMENCLELKVEDIRFPKGALNTSAASSTFTSWMANLPSASLPKPPIFRETVFNPMTKLNLSSHFDRLSSMARGSMLPLLRGDHAFVVGPAGTGKTMMMIIVTLARLDLSRASIQALFLVPTREIAVATATLGHSLLSSGPSVPFRTCGAPGTPSISIIIGGVPIGPHLAQLATCPPLVISTPGRLLDMVNRHNLTFPDISIVVVDEAPEFFDRGFRSDLEHLIPSIGSGFQHVMLASHSTEEIRNYQKRIGLNFIHLPHVSLGGDARSLHKAYTSGAIELRYCRVTTHDRIGHLGKMLQALHVATPVSHCVWIWASTDVEAASLVDSLACVGIDAQLLTAASVAKREELHDFTKDVSLVGVVVASDDVSQLRRFRIPSVDSIEIGFPNAETFVSRGTFLLPSQYRSASGTAATRLFVIGGDHFDAEYEERGCIRSRAPPTPAEVQWHAIKEQLLWAQDVNIEELSL